MFSWYVLKFKPGRDKLGLKTLQSLSIPYAYPMVTERRARRPVTVTPVFPGYALVYLDPGLSIAALDAQACRWLSWQALASLPGLSGVIHDGRTPLPVHDYLIDDIMLSDETLEPGVQVRIKVGPFAKFMAKVKSYDDSTEKYKITTEIFGRTSELQMFGTDLEIV